MSLLSHIPGLHRYAGAIFRVPEGTIIEGNIQVEASAAIAGVIRGNIQAKGKVSLAGSGVVFGNVYATDAEVHGTINGNLVCTGQANLHPTAVLRGYLQSAAIHLHPGSSVDRLLKPGEEDSAKLPEAGADVDNKLLATDTEVDQNIQKFMLPVEENQPETWF